MSFSGQKENLANKLLGSLITVTVKQDSLHFSGFLYTDATKLLALRKENYKLSTAKVGLQRLSFVIRAKSCSFFLGLTE